MPPTITEAFQPLSLRKLKSAKKILDQAPSYDVAAPLLDALVQHHPFVSCTWEASSKIFWRARKTSIDRPYTAVRDVLWPPVKKVGNGRANFPEQQTLYFSDRRETAASEALKRSQAAHFTGLRILPQKQVRLTPLGELFSIYRMGYGRILTGDAARSLEGMINACRRDEAQRLLITDALLFEIFHKTKDYRISAHILMKIREKIPESEGVIYHSVKQEGGLNFAISPNVYNEKFGLVSSFYCRSCKSLPFGLWDFPQKNHVVGIRSDGNFVFDEVVDLTEGSTTIMNPPFIGGGNPLE